MEQEGIPRNEKKVLFYLAEHIDKHTWITLRELQFLSEFNATSLWKAVSSLIAKGCIEQRTIKARGSPLKVKLNRFGREVYATLKKMEN